MLHNSFFFFFFAANILYGSGHLPTKTTFVPIRYRWCWLPGPVWWCWCSVWCGLTVGCWNWSAWKGWLSWSETSKGPGVSLTVRWLIREPWTLIVRRSLSSWGTSWLWINSRLPIPLERTQIASWWTVFLCKLCMIHLGVERNQNTFLFTLETLSLFLLSQLVIISCTYMRTCICFWFFEPASHI